MPDDRLSEENHFPWIGITEERVTMEMENIQKLFVSLSHGELISYGISREIAKGLFTLSEENLKWSGAELLVRVDIESVNPEDFAAPDDVDFAAEVWEKPEDYWVPTARLDLGAVLSSFQFMVLLFFLSPFAKKNYKKALSGVDLLFYIHAADSSVTVYHADRSGAGRNLWKLMVAATRDRYSK